ncbi:MULTISPECIES: glycosyltransferase family 87 protein [unclassified Nitrospina]|uniref:glycosyltransferase family 87 protein n=1 Tax=unclassified Nitrospina TaxID=2638683 RepID=UPI003F961AE7
MESTWPPSLHRRFVIFVFLALLIWGVTDVRYRASLHPDQPHKHRTDFTVYSEAGAAFFDGRDPYEVTNPRGWKYLYPPMLALVVAPVHGLPTHWQGLIWFALSVAMLWGCYEESVRLLGLAFRDRSLHLEKLKPYLLLVGGCASVAVLFPMLNCMQRGQIGIAKTYFLLLGFRLVMENRGWVRPFLGGVAMTVAVVLKVTPIVPVSFVAFQAGVAWLRKESRTAARPGFFGVMAGSVAGLLLFFLILPAGLVGWNANLKHLNTWYSKVGNQSVEFDAANNLDNPYTMRNQSFSNAVYRLGNWTAHVFFGGPPDKNVHLKKSGPMPMDAGWVQTTVLIVRVGLVLALFPLAIRLTKSDSVLNRSLLFGLACVAALIVSPVARGHYYMLQLPALVFVPLWLYQRGEIQWAKRMAVIPVALSLLHYALLPVTGRLGVLGIGTTVWYVLAVARLLSPRLPAAVVVDSGRPTG